jgi:hypothetical protein
MDEAVVENKASSTGRKGMVLPFQPLSLTFDDIKYFVDMPQVPYLYLRYNNNLN